MEKKVNIVLNCFYYGFYLLAAVAAGLMWYLVNNGLLQPIDTMSSAGQAIQYVVICYVIASVAGGLFAFKKLMERNMNQEKEKQLVAYRKWGIARICIIGLGIVLGITAFYLMGGYTSMIWCAAISAIGLYFCKPTLRKMEIELQNNPMAE